MVVEYDGTDYCGWQLQTDLPTIQGALERALGTILGHAVRVEASGRTDSGVHALGQVAAFSTPGHADARTMLRSLNGLAGKGIVIRGLREVHDSFDPRRDASRRTYEYAIDNRPYPSPFRRRFSWHVPAPLDVERMSSAASALVGRHDFASFQAADCDAEGSEREVFESVLEPRGDELIYRIAATSFLRHMVRNIVGTLVEVGRGARDADSIAALLAARDRRLAGATAPPRGLFLVRVDYEGRPGRSADRIDMTVR
jgi:tRNA pseudouridine38-40 synthase